VLALRCSAGSDRQQRAHRRHAVVVADVRTTMSRSARRRFQPGGRLSAAAVARICLPAPGVVTPQRRRHCADA
jgi:hypothetical protein